MPTTRGRAGILFLMRVHRGQAWGLALGRGCWEVRGGARRGLGRSRWAGGWERSLGCLSAVGWGFVACWGWKNLSPPYGGGCLVQRHVHPTLLVHYPGAVSGPCRVGFAPSTQPVGGVGEYSACVCVCSCANSCGHTCVCVCLVHTGFPHVVCPGGHPVPKLCLQLTPVPNDTPPPPRAQAPDEILLASNARPASACAGIWSLCVI